MYLIGLTGGIAAGKSTIAKIWSNLGGIEIDADELAREALMPGTESLQKVREAFGDVVFDGNTLDRKALANIVFADASKRAVLESIVHPKVKALAKERISALADNAIVIYNVPLLVEAASDLEFDLVVTVEAPRERQVERLVQNRGLSVAEATSRIDSQASAAERANVADEILSSNQPIIAMEKDAVRMWNKILQLAGADAGD